MTLKEQAFRQLDRITKLSEFKNEHGEMYIIYKIVGSDQLFITGDELDWDIGWEWGGARVLSQHFILSESEVKSASVSLREAGHA